VIDRRSIVGIACTDYEAIWKLWRDASGFGPAIESRGTLVLEMSRNEGTHALIICISSTGPVICMTRLRL